MSTEAAIKDILEDYLRTEEAFSDLSRERDEALKEYQRCLRENFPQNNTYELDAAAEIIGAYNAFRESERKIQENSLRANELSVQIKEYLRALNGANLHLHFAFDSLDHRAGDHVFYLEDEKLKVRHSPVSIL